MQASILGAMLPAAKWVPSARYSLRLGERQAVDPALLRLAEVERHPLDGRGDHEHVGLELGRQQRAGEVLVDHRGHAVQEPGGVARRPGSRRRRP